MADEDYRELAADSIMIALNALKPFADLDADPDGEGVGGFVMVDNTDILRAKGTYSALEAALTNLIVD